MVEEEVVVAAEEVVVAAEEVVVAAEEDLLHSTKHIELMQSISIFLVVIPAAKDLFAGIPPNTLIQQNHISRGWMATNWNGICDELTKVSNPTLIITGNHDKTYQQPTL